MHIRQRFALVTVLVLAAAFLTPTAPGSASTPDSVTQRTISQIDALSKAKLARTNTQRKVDSSLLAEIAMRSGAPVAEGITSVRTGVAVSKGLVTVDLLHAPTTRRSHRAAIAFSVPSPVPIDDALTDTVRGVMPPLRGARVGR